MQIGARRENTLRQSKATASAPGPLIWKRGANNPRESGRFKIKEVFPDITLGHGSSGQIKNRLLCCPDHKQTGPTHRPCLWLPGLSGKLPEFVLDEVLRAAVLIVPSASSHPSCLD